MIGSLGKHKGRFSRYPPPVLSAEGPCEQFRHGKGCPLSNNFHPAFSLPTTASPTVQGAPRDGFGEAVVACDMPEPCKFPSLDICQKKFLWSHKETDLDPHPVVGLVLKVGDTKYLVSKAWILFVRVSKQDPCFTAAEEDEGDKRLVELELACRADGVAPPDSVLCGYCSHCSGNPDADFC